jgi:hypothetical protein
MAEQDTTRAVPREGQAVVASSGEQLGTVAEVWADAGVAESWGAVGSRLMSGTEATDDKEFAFSEAMPGEGESYFRLLTPDGTDLYVPMSYISTIEGERVVLSVDADEVPMLRWDLRPDFLHEAKPRPGPSEGSTRPPLTPPQS